MDGELVQRPRPEVARRAREAFDELSVNLIRDTVAKDASLPELHLFLELAARYELDPFAGEIWCAKMGGENASGGRMTIMVGRDGFLAIANRSGEFEGMDGDVVRANDEFNVKMVDGERIVTHNYDVNATVEAGSGDLADDGRGPIVGAWTIVYRTGRKPTYFFARWDEYVPKSEAKRTKTPWGVQESSMILKCAQSMALRLAFNITGLVGAEEAHRQLARRTTEEDDSFDLGPLDDDAEIARVTGLLNRANELRPGSYRPAKVRLLFAGKSSDELERIVEGIEQFVANLEAKVIEGAEVVEATSVEA